MELRQMEYFVALADEEQFTRAAALCGVSQSGLSAAIRTLEDELGTVLFHRTTRRVEPTDAGRALLPHARTLIAQAAAARDAVGRSEHDLTGPVRVGTEQCLGTVDVHGILDRVHRLAPDAGLTFEQAGSRELADRVRGGELDIAFVAVTDHLGTLQRTELGRQHLVLLVRPDDPLAAGDDPDWTRLGGRDYVDFHESWAIRSLVDAAFLAHGISRRVHCAVGDVHALLDLVQRGLGVAIVPAHVARKPQAGGLVTRALPADAPAWVVSAITAPPANSAALTVLQLMSPASASAREDSPHPV